MFTSGLAMFAAAAQVYFRDTQALMPFVLAINDVCLTRTLLSGTGKGTF
jgi:hypothetical protein